MVRNPAEARRHGLVHGAHGHPDDDESGRRSGPRVRPGSLRFLASVGEPLNPEAVVWGRKAFGLPFHDNWWQTETGGIMIANYAAWTSAPARWVGRSRGRGRHCAKDDDGHVRRSRSRTFRGNWPCGPAGHRCFAATGTSRSVTRKCFAGGWYLTGDLARRDRDGYFWFVGRKDDVIKTSGHLIGPFEVESVLLEHKAVAEAGVIGKPDPAALEIVKAFVTLKPGFEASDELRRELMAFARTRLGRRRRRRKSTFSSLPRTRAGKIMRRLLKARELGLPEGDTSTLETG